jgi:hypothetical protein
MVITCSLEAEDSESEQPDNENVVQTESDSGKTKGQGVCSHCGNESEIWLDM